MQQASNRKKVAALVAMALLLLIVFVGMVNSPNASGTAINGPSELFLGYNEQSSSWTPGNLGNGYTEGDFASYQLRIDSSSKVWGASEFNITFTFYQSSSDAVYVDGFDTSSDSGFMYSTGDILADGVNVPSSGWGIPISVPEAGVLYPVSGAQITNYMHPSPSGSDDGTPAGSTPSGERYFTVSNLPWSDFTDHVVIFFRAHLALSIVWANGLESNLPVQMSGDEFQLWDAPHDGSSFISGSSGHFGLDYPGIGTKTAPMPVTDLPQVIIDGYKYLNGALTNGWTVQLKGLLDVASDMPAIPYEATAVTGSSPDPSDPWSAGYFKFTGLTTGLYNISEALNGYQCVEITANPPGFELVNDPKNGTEQVHIEEKYPTAHVTVNFYNAALGTIDGYKYEDHDLDLTTTGDETRVANWPIYLYAADGTTLISQTTTDSNGYYKFVNLISGTYVVKEGTLGSEWFSISFSSVTVSLGSTAFGHASFVNAVKGEISGYKYEDKDLTKTHTDGDVGIAGWDISLLKYVSGAYQSVGTTTTDENGHYCFTGLMPGAYKVVEGTDTAYYNVTDQEVVLTISQSGQSLTADFYNVKKMSIEGYKYEDCDFDPATTGDYVALSGWTIELVKDGQVIATDTTDENGKYCFAGLEAGTYTVREVVQDGWFTTGESEYCITLDESGEVAVQDFTNARYGSISVYKYEDVDWSGTLTGGDKAVPGWTIYLYYGDGTEPIQTVVTNSSGGYLFTNLDPGVYVVKEDTSVAGWKAVSDVCATFTIAVSGDVQSVNFFNAQLMSISGYKYEDVNLDPANTTDDLIVEGWTIDLFAADGTTLIASTTTDADGHYVFSGLTPGTYIVKEGARNGWFNVSSDSVQVTLATSGEGKVANFFNAQLMSIEGYKLEDMDWSGDFTCGDIGVNNWCMFLYVRTDCGWEFVTSTQTSDCGHYQFLDLMPGEYKVVEGCREGWTNVSSAAVRITLDTSGQEGRANFFNAQLMSITGYKYEDVDWSGDLTDADKAVCGWTVYLYDDQGNLVRSVETASDGSYSFTGLKPGTYWVEEESRCGWFNVTPDEVCVELSTSGQERCVDFYNAQLMSIEGYKFEDVDWSGGFTCGDKVVSCWPIYLYVEVDGCWNLVTSTHTSYCGHYEFHGLLPGHYKVVEGAKDGWTNVSSDEACITLDTSGQTSYACFFNAQYMSISGYKYDDVNLDPENATDDLVVEGWTIELYASDGITLLDTTTTDKDGYYAFAGLTPGTYIVREGSRVGWFNVSSDCVQVTLATSGEGKTVSFYNAQLMSIEGNKYEDMDWSGDLSCGDTGVEGWCVFLFIKTDCGWEFVDSTSTNCRGHYEFAGLMPGEYKVVEGTREGWTNVSSAAVRITLDTSGQVERADFFNAQFMTISGYKYEDVDLSGTLTPGDHAVPCWTVCLYDGCGQLVGTTQTACDGSYSFTGLKPGTYWVEEDVRCGWFNVTSDEVRVRLCTSGQERCVDFFNAKLMSISGYKIEDVDWSGGFNCGDKAVSCWPIYLYAADGTTLLDTTWTDGCGYYSFTGLIPGTYIVKEDGKCNWVCTDDQPCKTAVLDSSGECAWLSFYNAELMSISGYKVEDMDLSGTWSCGDKAVGGWTVELWLDGCKVNCTVTNECGFYEFTGLLPGHYTVKEKVRCGWFNVTSSTKDVCLGTSGECRWVSFYNAQLMSVEGYKYEDMDLDGQYTCGTDRPVEGFTIELWLDGAMFRSTTTDPDGYYEFDDLMPGDYVIKEFAPSGEENLWFNVTASEVQVSLTTSGQVATEDFFNARYMTIEGYKYEDCDLDPTTTGDQSPLADWTIKLYRGETLVATTTTDENGHYCFALLAPGEYTVKEVLPECGWFNITAVCQDVVLDCSGEVAQASFYNAQLMTIIGYKYEDMDWSGDLTGGDVPLSCWTIYLFKQEGCEWVEVGTTVTDGNGYYEFTCLLPGDYKVIEECGIPRWTNTADRAVCVELDHSGEVAGVDFFNARYMTIEGYKYEDKDQSGGWSCRDSPVAGWTMYLYKQEGGEWVEVGTAVTDCSGHYCFVGLTLGVYKVVEECRNGWVPVTPDSIEVSLGTSGQVVGADFLNLEVCHCCCCLEIWKIIISKIAGCLDKLLSFILELVEWLLNTLCLNDWHCCC
jgi:uncharacterized surface anchored protein